MKMTAYLPSCDNNVKITEYNAIANDSLREVVLSIE